MSTEWKPYEPAEAPPKRKKPRRVSIVEYLERQKRDDRGRTQGFGCLFIILATALAFFVPPLAGLLALIGIVLLVVGLVR